MQLKRVEIIKYRNFENIVIDFEKSDFPNVFSIASKNGGGKSTLLQFIFIMLHCFMDEDKQKYIQNLLEEFQSIAKEMEFVEFLIEDKGQEYNLRFYISNVKDTYRDFNLYLDLKDTENKIEEYKQNINEYQKIIELKKEIDNNDRITPIINRNLRYIRKYINSQIEDDLYRDALRTESIETYKKLLNSIITRNSIFDKNIDELTLIYNEVNQQLEALELILREDNLLYITHLKNKQNVLLLDTTMSQDLLKRLSNKVFLTAPNSQIFLFLSNEEKHAIFNEFSNEVYYYQSYYDSIKKSKKQLNGFFTYDFASTELILQSFKKASEEDLRIKRKTRQYGSKYDELTDELKDFLDGKEITENEEGDRVIFKLKSTGEELSPEDLSHGELKKLGIYIWLKYIVEEDSIVLMDEVDIALHPKWQYELVQDLVKWSNGTQFLLATHSPQILSSTYYKNIIKLENGGVKRYNKPPLDRDINAIITQIMEAPDFPEDLKELHIKYRKLINEGKVETEEAKKLKEKILEYESENSAFFQEINFDLELI